MEDLAGVRLDGDGGDGGAGSRREGEMCEDPVPSSEIQQPGPRRQMLEHPQKGAREEAPQHVQAGGGRRSRGRSAAPGRATGRNRARNQGMTPALHIRPR